MLTQHQAPKRFSKFSKQELDTFFKQAKAVYKDQAFTILKQPVNYTFGKLLLVVPKQYGNAPERNLIKRRLKSIFREEKLYEKPSIIAFILRASAKKLSFNDLKRICLAVLG